jgi:hypothetical protein
MMVVYCGSLAIAASILMASVAVSEALNRSANRERKFLPNLKFRFRGVAFGYE